MPTLLKDETILVREAIREVLEKATQPVTSIQIASSYAVSSLGLELVQITNALYQLMNRKRPLFPIARIRYGGKGHAQWAYYNPEVCQPLVVRTAAPKPQVEEPVEEPQVNAVNSEFTFNPVELTEQAPKVTLPPTVKGITLIIDGVVIKIELTS